MPVQVEKLLDRLCVDLGFCLPPEDYIRLAGNPPSRGSRGMNPEMA